MTITAHTIIKNEEKWVWYAIRSALEHVDEIIVWDTGSTDATLEIVNSINSPKIKIYKTPDIDPDSFTHVRQKALEMTKSDWLLMLDGDEIWPEESIAKTINIINTTGGQYEYLIHPHYNLVGDVYHYQDLYAGRYKIGQYMGLINVRFINLKILPKLHFSKPHGQQGLFDTSNTLIQDRDPFRALYIDCPYLHTTHLSRSSKDSSVMKRLPKYKFDTGISFPSEFMYPKAFYLPRPPLVPSPWRTRSSYFFSMALIQSPFKAINRRFVKKNSSGY